MEEIDIEESGEIERLPVECISHVLSLSSPIDVCRSAAASRMFATAAVSDDVWEAFLPPNCKEMLSRASVPVASYPSTKELYFRLCEPLLIDNGRKSFQLERASGKVCLALSHRELAIEVSKSNRNRRRRLFMTWETGPPCRFRNAAQLYCSRKAEITGRIDTAALTRETAYAAYLVFQPTYWIFGYMENPYCTWNMLRYESPQEFVSRFCDERDSVLHLQASCISRVGRASNPFTWREQMPSFRADGWLEMALGEFLVSDHELDDEVEVYCREIQDVIGISHGD